MGLRVSLHAKVLVQFHAQLVVQMAVQPQDVQTGVVHRVVPLHANLRIEKVAKQLVARQLVRQLAKELACLLSTMKADKINRRQS